MAFTVIDYCTHPSIFRNRPAILRTHRITVFTERYKSALGSNFKVACLTRNQASLHKSNTSTLLSVSDWKDSHLNVANKQLSQKRWPHIAVCTGFRMARRQMGHLCPEDNSSTKTKSNPPVVAVCSVSSKTKISSPSVGNAIANWGNWLLAPNRK